MKPVVATPAREDRPVTEPASGMDVRRLPPDRPVAVGPPEREMPVESVPTNDALAEIRPMRESMTRTSALAEIEPDNGIAVKSVPEIVALADPDPEREMAVERLPAELLVVRMVPERGMEVESEPTRSALAEIEP